LVGDKDDLLKNESAKVVIDTDDDWSTTGDQITKDITGLGDANAVTFSASNVGSGDKIQKITVSATARDKTLATIKYSKGDDDPSANVRGTATLSVVMEPSKA